MRALWSDRPNCSHNVSQKVKRIRRLSEFQHGEKIRYGRSKTLRRGLRNACFFEVEEAGKRSTESVGEREPRTIPTKDLPHPVVFFGGWCANCRNSTGQTVNKTSRYLMIFFTVSFSRFTPLEEPKKKAKDAPRPVLHSRCWSSNLWGWCVDFMVLKACFAAPETSFEVQ